MPQAHSPSDSRRPLLQPPCSTCGMPMWLMRISPVDSKHDVRTFECQVCKHSETIIVERGAS